jgi:hypothetical protein
MTGHIERILPKNSPPAFFMATAGVTLPGLAPAVFDLSFDAASKRLKQASEAVICSLHTSETKYFPMNSPRTAARRHKIRDSLDGRQVEELKRWLLAERLTYDKVRDRLREQFGLSVASGTLSKFWQEECQPEEPRSQRPSPEILLDVILQSKSPIRLTILKNGGRLALKVGRNWKSGAKKGKSIVIGPDLKP